MADTRIADDKPQERVIPVRPVPQHSKEGQGRNGGGKGMGSRCKEVLAHNVLTVRTQTVVCARSVGGTST